MPDSTPVPALPTDPVSSDRAPAGQLWSLWRRGRQPDVGVFLVQAGPLPPVEVVAVLRVDQRERWGVGERVSAEDYLERYPAVRDDPDSAVDLVYSEFLLREERGEAPAPDEYLRRFPDYASVLGPQIEMHRLMADEDTGSGTSIYVKEEDDDADASLPRVPGYEILGVLGRGGMGVVYQARQTSLNRVVALKVILTGTHADPEQQRRFHTEAEAIARLRHPNIIQIHDCGFGGGSPYLALEFVEGGTLAQKTAGNPQPPRDAARGVETLALAVHHAHRAGLVHRDLKPANVLVTADGVHKITDFGLAKHLTSEADASAAGARTGSGAILGTPTYMAPEQVASGRGAVGPAADVYSLGVILYELLTGRPPFQGNSVLEVLRKVQEQEPLPPSRLRLSVPRDLETICLKCLEKEPGRRYATAAALAEDLRRFQAGEPILARPVGVVERSWRWCRRNPLGATVAGLLLVIAVGASVLSLWLSAALTRVRDAQDATQRQLFDSLVNQALAETRSRRSGQRFASLALLDEAVERVRHLNLPTDKLDGLRNATLAALVMPDLFPEPGDGLPSTPGGADFDDALEVYVRTGAQGNVSVRRVEGDRELHILPSPDPAAHLAIPYLSRDARFVAVKSCDRQDLVGRARLWKLDGPEPEVVCTEEKVHDIDFRPDGKAVAFSHDGGAITLYDLPSGRPLRPLEPNALTREVRIALHPTEPLVAVGSYFAKPVQVRDLRTGEVVQSLEVTKNCHHVAWHPVGHTLAVSDLGTIHLYDRATFQRRLTFGSTGGGDHLYFNHAGDRLMAYGWDATARLYEVVTGQLLLQIPQMRTPCSFLRFDRNDRRLAGFIKDGRLRLWQVADGREYRTLTDPALPAYGGFHSPTVSPDGRLLVAVMQDGIGFWDLDTGAPLDRLRLEKPGFALFEPGPDAALLTGDARGTFRWPIRRAAADPGRWRFGPPRPLSLPPGAACRSDDGRTLVTGFRAVGTVQPWAGAWVWHADRPNAPLHLEAGSDLSTIALSPDGQWLVTRAHGGGSLKLCDARTGQLQQTLAGGGTYANFSPDGRWLAVGGADGRLFEVATWAERLRPGTAAHFAPDSRTLVAWTDTHALRLVEGATGRELTRLEDPHLDRASALLFTPDGGRLLTINYSKGVHIWDLRLLRAELARRGRDWDAPSYRPAPAPGGPLRLEFDWGNYARLSEALAVENFDRSVREAPHLAVRWYFRGLFHQRAGRHKEALADLRWAVDKEPNRHLFCNALARLYATGPAEVRDEEQAVELAGRAVRLRPGDWTYHTTLGIAYYRAGRDADAVAVLEKSLASQEERHTAFGLYFLAMGHHRLGDVARALTRFQQARARQEQYAGRLSPDEAEELKRFRAEAAALLGQPSGD